MESFSERRNLARVTAGFKGGPFYKNLNLAPSMRIVDGWPAGTEQKLHMVNVKTGVPVDVWNQRRSR